MKKEIQIIDFNQSGDNILIITGTHGNEISPLFFGVELSQYIKNKTYKNIRSVHFIHGLNESAIRNNTREIGNPDLSDLNRSFTFYDYNPKDFLINYVESNNISCIMDIHSSPRLISPFFLIDYDMPKNKEYENFLLGANLLFVKRAFDGETIKRYYSSIGINAFTLEIPGMNVYTDNTESVNIVDKFFIQYNSFNTMPELLESDNIYKSMQAKTSGMLHYNTHFGKYQKGEIISYITNYSNKTLQKFEMEHDGYPIYFNERDFIIAGEEVAFIKYDARSEK